MDSEPQIRFLKGGQAGKVLSLGKFERLDFGRADQANVVVKDALASKKHFVLERRKRAYYIVDQKSTNGTLVNGERVSERRIYHEDVIGIGATEIVFLCPEAQEPSETTHFFDTGGTEETRQALPKRTDEIIRDLVGHENRKGGGLDTLFLHLLYDLTNMVSQEMDLRRVAGRSLEKLAQTLEMQRGVIVDKNLEPLAEFTIRGRWDGILKPPLRGILEKSVSQTLSIRRTVSLDASKEDPDETLRAGEAHVSVYCAPLRGPEGSTGAIYLDRAWAASEGEEPHADEVLSIVTLAGRQIGLAVDRAKLLQEKLLSEERYRVLVEEANDCIFLLDKDGNFEFVNSRADAVLGASKPAILCRAFLDLIPPALREGIHDRIETALSQRAAQNFETEVERLDGRRSTVSFSLVPLKGEQGEFLGLLGIGRDVTEERKMQEHIMQAERLASLGQLVSGMAHELNNPLTSIVGFSQILAGDESLPEGVRRRISMIFQEGERASTLLKNLLAFAQPPDTRRIHVDVNETLGKTLERVRHDLESIEADVLTSFDELPPIPGDETQFQQVFLSIIKNAIESMGESPREGRLVLKTWRIEDKVHVSISDNGPGMPPEIIKRIFDPFFTTRKVGKGMGLGLSICYKIVTAHGGRISVDSTPGEGTTFEIVLPSGRRGGL